MKRKSLMYFYFFLVGLFMLPQKNISQNQMVTFAGNVNQSYKGAATFNDIMKLSNGKYLVLGVDTFLTWLPTSTTKLELTIPGIGITNFSGTKLGTNKICFILQVSSDLQTIEKAYYIGTNKAEDFKFIKHTSRDGLATGDIFISGNTVPGYFIGRLNDNFVNASPTGFSWVYNVVAQDGCYPKLLHPWDVGSDGKVVYAQGDSHGYNWAATYRLNTSGEQEVVPKWIVHWATYNGKSRDGLRDSVRIKEVHGNSDTITGVIKVRYSAIIFKRDGRGCLRSWSYDDHNLWQSDGNGGQKKGKFPMDALYGTYIGDPLKDELSYKQGAGYTGYTMQSQTQTFGIESMCIDRITNDLFIGFNFQSVLPGGLPDFEPAVMKMNKAGDMLWWSRLYHEKDPSGNLNTSTPDQYIDGLAIDYKNNYLVVNARCHGNNTENFWEGNTINANPGAKGFRNQFSGTFGNAHYSWLGKLKLSDATLMHSTYVAEYSYKSPSGTPYTDPNLSQWIDFNSGWNDLNTTKLRPNTIKVDADGAVLVIGTGKRVVTTKNAYQQMCATGDNTAPWTDFVRLYKPDLSGVLYSSILRSNWTLGSTTWDGGTISLNNVIRTDDGLITVGFSDGAQVYPTFTNVPGWGVSTAKGNTPFFAKLTVNDYVSGINDTKHSSGISVYPNPVYNSISFIGSDNLYGKTYLLTNILGAPVLQGIINASSIAIDGLPTGIYLLNIDGKFASKVLKK